jgi:hypothetical protein
MLDCFMYSEDRIKLLSPQEIDAIYAIPVFNKTEQDLYFSLSDEEMLIVKEYRTVKAKIYFIRTLGYFKAKQQFYKFNLGQDSHTQYILEKYFDKNKPAPSGKLDFKTYQKQKNNILTLLAYQDWLPENEAGIQSYLNGLLKIYPKGHDALRQLLIYFDHKQIVLPSYRTLQDLFTSAFAAEDKRLNDLMAAIDESKKEQLSILINKKDGVSPLNIIRSDQKNFKYTATRAEVSKSLEIIDLYEFAKHFLPSLNLSKNAIRYYADLAEQYAASRLRRLNKPQQWLQTLCFVYHRSLRAMESEAMGSRPGIAIG